MEKNNLKPRAEKPHKRLKSPFYVITTSAQSYSNIAGVLAGFAFTAVVLVVQTALPSKPINDIPQYLRQN